MSDVKIYIVNFAVSEQTSLPIIHQYLGDSVDILGYWNYIPLVYCVKTRLDATELSRKLTPFFQANFLVIEVNPFNANGRMMQESAWTWFHEPPAEKRPLLAARLGDLFALPVNK